ALRFGDAAQDARANQRGEQPQHDDHDEHLEQREAAGLLPDGRHWHEATRGGLGGKAGGRDRSRGAASVQPAPANQATARDAGPEMRWPTHAQRAPRTLITRGSSIGVTPRGSFLMAVIGTKLRGGGSSARLAALTGLG